jgi:hypothetical protein
LGPVIPKHLINGPCNYAEQNEYLKENFRFFRGMMGVGRGLIAHHSLLILKKGSKTFNSQSNELQ